MPPGNDSGGVLKPAAQASLRPASLPARSLLSEPE